MDITVNKKGFYKVVKKIFSEIAEDKEGYPLLIPIFSDHQIYINGLLIFLDKTKEHFLSVNSYGQMNIVRRNDDGSESNHICFSISQLDSIEFLTRNVYGSINEKTGDYYNDFFRFKLTG